MHMQMTIVRRSHFKLYCQGFRLGCTASYVGRLKNHVVCSFFFEYSHNFFKTLISPSVGASPIRSLQLFWSLSLALSDGMR